MRGLARALAALLLAAGALAHGGTPARAQPGPTLAAGFVQEQLADGLNPSAMRLAPDGRLFIVDKGGRVLVYRDGALRPEPFLTLDVDDTNERGLSGIAFHPDFADNGWVYVYYTPPRSGFNRVSRVRANGDFAVPGSEEVLLELQPLEGASIHNGGAMEWLPDGTLLIATGDGGFGGVAQEPGSQLGKVLRIRDDGSVPEDNPFASAPTPAGRTVYALGFRNPFTMAAQAGTGRVFANDVGGESWEEVNDVRAGANYGWPLVEGPDGLADAPPDHRRAVFEYSHDEGCAIVGAAFYGPGEGSDAGGGRTRLSFPEAYHGSYLFGDYCLGYIQAIDPATGDFVAELARGLDRVIALQVDTNGTLYYLARGTGDGSQTDNTSTTEGTLWRISYTGSGAPLVSRPPRDALVPLGDTARFGVSVSGQPPYTYRWLLDGEVEPAATGASFALAATSLAQDGAQVRAIVSNAFGTDTSAAATLNVTANTRPTVTIASPAPATRYIAGDRIALAGSATDAEEGAVPARYLDWTVAFHHDDHTHPVTGFQGADGAFEIPRVGEVSSNVFYRATLATVDSGGLRASASVDVYPELAELRFATDPPGLRLNADGFSDVTPYALESVVGLERVAQAPPVQALDGELYLFEAWTEGGGDAPDSLVQEYTVPAEGQGFTARYTRLERGTGTGLVAKFWAGDQPGVGDVLHTRVDTTVDVDWGWESPAEAVPVDNFCARWEGVLEPPLDGAYTFTLGSNDGSRLYLDGELVIDNWDYQTTTYRDTTVVLEAGRRLPVRVEFFEWILDAEVSLAWDHASLPAGVVPTWALYPDTSAIPTSIRERSADGLELVATHVPEADELLVYVCGPAELRGRALQLRVVNAVGQVVAERTHAAAGDWELVRIPTGGLVAGVYTVAGRLPDGRREAVSVVVR